MNSKSPERPLHTEGVLTDYFIMEARVFSALFSGGFKAIEKSRGQGALVWTFNVPLQRNGAGVHAYLQRMAKVDQIDPPVSNLSAYGVDRDGTAFAVYPYVDGTTIGRSRIERGEAERRVISSLQLVQRMHKAGIVIGDLCAESFFVDRSGHVTLSGIMGVNQEGVEQAFNSVSAEQRCYLAPELLEGGGKFSLATDVYAFGVLAAYLLIGELPFTKAPSDPTVRADLDSILSKLQNAPIWAELVLRSSLQVNPSDRAKSCDQLSQLLFDSITQSQASEQTPVNKRSAGQLAAKPRTSLITGPAVGSAAIDAGMSEEKLSQQASLSKHLRQQSPARLVTLGIVFMLATVYILFSGSGSKVEDTRTPGNGVGIAVEGISPGIGSESGSAGGAERSLAEKAAEFDSLANSDDPLAHDLLVKNARDASTDRLRQMAEQAIIDRARRLGLLRSAEQVRQWLRSVKTGSLPANYESVLQALDTTLPLEARTSALRQAYPVNPLMVTRLTSALALDVGETQQYQPVLSQLVGDATKDENVSKLSTLGIILGNADLALVFGDDVIQRREQIPDQDVLYLLNVLAQRGDPNLRAMASLAMERGIMSPMRASFLKIVRDRDDLEPNLINALVRASVGAPSTDDIGQFGRWYDIESEHVLLAVCASAKEKGTLVEAFDTLAGKSLVSEPSASLVNWVRGNYWEQRGDFAFPIGVLGSLSMVQQADVDQAVQVLSKYSADRRLIDILSNSTDPRIVAATIKSFSGRLGLNGLLSLLSNPDKDVRIMAVKSLKDYNDVAALRLIIEQYERERDADVKQAYRETFWVIQQREQPK